MAIMNFNDSMQAKMLGFYFGALSVMSGKGWNEKHRSAGLQISKTWQARMLSLTQATIIFMLVAMASAAFAQVGGGDGGASALCEFAKWLKNIATVAGLIALFLFVMNSFFAKSSIIGDVIMYVVIGCVVMTAGSYLIGKTGLQSTCNP